MWLTYALIALNLLLLAAVAVLLRARWQAGHAQGGVDVARAHRSMQRMYVRLQGAATNNTLTPQLRWFYDNYFFLRISALQAQRRLQGLTAPRAGRMLQLCAQLVLNERARINDAALCDFFSQYQLHTPLTLKELSLLRECLQAALVCRAQRTARQGMDTLRQWRSATAFAQYIADHPGQSGRWAARARRTEYLRAKVPGGAFVERLSHLLMERGECAVPGLRWLDEYLQARGHVAEDIIRHANNQQNRQEMLLSNCVGSLRWISTISSAGSAWWSVSLGRTRRRCISA